MNPKELHRVCNQVQSATDLSNIKSESIDYIFTDPPFGHNLMYSELNFIHEDWLKLYTDNKEEAIENASQDKDVTDYIISTDNNNNPTTQDIVERAGLLTDE